MVLNNFGQSNKTRKSYNVHGSKGDPGIGFHLTTNGDYVIQNKRLCNVSEPKDVTDVCTKRYVSEVIKGYENTIQAVDNKYHSETTRLNSLIMTQGIDINDKITQFSNSTQRIIDLKDGNLTKMVNDIKHTLNVNITELSELTESQKASTISTLTTLGASEHTLNKKIEDLNKKLDTNIGELLDLLKATTESIPTLMNNELKRFEYLLVEP